MEPLEDYGSTLAELGMTVTDSSDLTEPTLPTFAAWRARVEENESTLRDLIGPQGVEDFVGSTNVLESFWLDGTLGYGILAAVKRPDSKGRT
jgi:27-O-demethylrifamycin SV methyltransferase